MTETCVGGGAGLRTFTGRGGNAPCVLTVVEMLNMLEAGEVVVGGGCGRRGWQDCGCEFCPLLLLMVYRNYRIGYSIQGILSMKCHYLKTRKESQPQLTNNTFKLNPSLSPY